MRGTVLNDHLWLGISTVLDLSKGRGTARMKIGARFTNDKLRVV